MSMTLLHNQQVLWSSGEWVKEELDDLRKKKFYSLLCYVYTGHSYAH